MNFMTKNPNNQFNYKVELSKESIYKNFNLFQSSAIYENNGQNIINLTVVKLFSLTLILPTYIPIKIATFKKYITFLKGIVVVYTKYQLIVYQN